jgi:uncharacterized protein (TIGR02099 family)
MSLIHRSLHIAGKQLYYLILIGLFLGLLGLGSGVWLSENISQRKDEIAQWASDKLGQTVEIGSVDLYWLDLFPKLRVNALTVSEQHQSAPVLTVDSVFIGLDLIRSLSQQQPVIDEAQINGLQLSLSRDRQNIQVLGLSTGGNYSSSANPLDFVDMLSDIELTNISINYHDEQYPNLSGDYLISAAQIKHNQQRWIGKTRLHLPESLGSAISIDARLELNDKQQPKEWQIDGISEQLNLAKLLQGQNFEGIELNQGAAAVHIQASSHPVRGQSVSANIDLNDAALTQQDNASLPAVAIQHFSGEVNWAKQPQRWQLTGNNINITMAQKAWPKLQFSVNKQADGSIDGQASYLRLSDLSALAALHPQSSAMLVQQKPAGDVSELAFKFVPNQGLQQLSFVGRDVSVLPWQDYPGANGLSFRLDWQSNEASLNLFSHKVSLYPEQWLKDAVYFDSINGSLSWKKQLADWKLAAHGLSLWNDDMNLQLDGTLSYANAAYDSKLTLRMEDFIVPSWKKYVPVAKLDANFWNWAEHAFVDGKVRQGTISLQGDPTKFPFDEPNATGKFDMQLDVEGVQLHFGLGWPDLMAVNGHISGSGNDLLIQSQSGSIADMQFASVTTKINNLVKKGPVLTTDAELTGSSQQTLDFLKKSPLKTRFGKIPEWISATGNSKVKLDLTVPLTHVDDTQASGDVAFIDTTLSYAAIPQLQFTQVNGELQFSNEGVKANGIKAIAFDQPVSIGVQPEQQSTLVTINGGAAVATLRDLWPEFVPSQLIGDFAYQTQIRVKEQQLGQFELAVSMQTDLQNVAADFPAPFNKQAGEKRPFSWTLKEHDSDQLALSFHYADIINGAFHSKADNSWTGAFRFGQQPATVPQSGLVIQGELASLSLDDWLQWQTQQPTTESSMLDAVENVSLAINSLSVKGQTLSNLVVDATQQNHDWLINLSSDQLKGEVMYPAKNSAANPLIVDLDYLNWRTQQNSQPATSEQQALWPSIKATIDQLVIDNMQLGKLVLSGQQHNKHWQLSNASLTSEVLDASAKGVWSQTDTGESTNISATLKSDDLKGLLANLGYQQAISARNNQVLMEFSWPGSPMDMAVKNLDGTLSLKMGRGQLLDVEPGAAGRIFGLMSFAAIPRRLSLDFSDLFGKGFGFSEISGNFAFNQGFASTDDLKMQGESALITIKGPVNLRDKSYDQTVTITPNVSSTLPLAGAATGGPVGLGVGTAIMLVDKIASSVFGKEIVNLISYSYHLSGPWSDPKLKVLTTDKP